VLQFFQSLDAIPRNLNEIPSTLLENADDVFPNENLIIDNQDVHHASVARKEFLLFFTHRLLFFGRYIKKSSLGISPGSLSPGLIYSIVFHPLKKKNRIGENHSSPMRLYQSIPGHLRFPRHPSKWDDAPNIAPQHSPGTDPYLYPQLNSFNLPLLPAAIQQKQPYL
jgi:hypothetical protein